MRTLPDAVVPLVEYNVRRAWRNDVPKDNPYEILGDRRSPAEIDRACESARDLYHLRRGVPPGRGWNSARSSEQRAFVRETYRGFSEESYAQTLDYWYFVMR